MIDCFALDFTQSVLKLSETSVRSEIALKTLRFCTCRPIIQIVQFNKIVNHKNFIKSCLANDLIDFAQGYDVITLRCYERHYLLMIQ